MQMWIWKLIPRANLPVAVIIDHTQTLVPINRFPKPHLDI
jgi:hypothetical protein